VSADVSEEHIASISGSKKVQQETSVKVGGKQNTAYFLDSEDGGDMFLRNVD
jgi:hypothetical protein